MTDSFFGEVDTAHLSMPYSDKEFTISSAHFARLAEQCHYRLMGDIVLFGIRAAQSLSQKGKWLTEIKITENRLDYLYLNCLLGLWDRKNHKIAIFQGSTVPFKANVIKQRENPNQRISNQLAQGLYQYYVGAHEPDHRPKEEGAFRLTRHVSTPVWRDYGKGQLILDACAPNDHIHAAGSIDTDYKSAGCQVISGFHNSAMPEGEYQQFRILAGQSALPSELELHLPYQYLLTHTRHLHAIQQGCLNEYLMQGSEGYLVRELQEQLIAENYLFEQKIDKGLMDGKTVKAVYEWQKASSINANGIYHLESFKL
ncbi:peptidoglycan-binding domain-containing protein [Wohlfahrtiimonas larvae]|uniref:Peptidoglycan binding-like domain-containing protein n=1 Tax=Wohlfahrtiimonas larvae TaxID=1157986 RepID=A0ABP9MCC8_9GAMM|nr:peptidoglycan-binding domain-containing protein [Wohlfahrtiimonas larvae]